MEELSLKLAMAKPKASPQHLSFSPCAHFPVLFELLGFGEPLPSQEMEVCFKGYGVRAGPQRSTICFTSSHGSSVGVLEPIVFFPSRLPERTVAEKIG